MWGTWAIQIPILVVSLVSSTLLPLLAFQPFIIVFNEGITGWAKLARRANIPHIFTVSHAAPHSDGGDTSGGRGGGPWTLV